MWMVSGTLRNGNIQTGLNPPSISPLSPAHQTVVVQPTVSKIL